MATLTASVSTSADCATLLSQLSLVAETQAPPKTRIGIYNGPGSDEDNVKHLKQSCEELLENVSVHLLSAETLSTNDIDVLVMGGGEASPMEEALGTSGAEKIYNAVHRDGIGFVGFCASACLASKERAFAGSGKGIIQSKLPLFPGKTWGPALSTMPHLHPFDIRAAQACTIELAETKEQGKVHYVSGPTFNVTKAHEDAGIKPLAYYTAHGYPEPAAISFPSGKGMVRLCAVHPEHNKWATLSKNVTCEHFNYLATQLSPHTQFQQKLFRLLFKGFSFVKR